MAAGEARGPDRRGAAPHPRERDRLIGHAGAEAAFLAAWREGRLHHAWLLAGPEGVGKATFAYRVATFLLAHPPARAHEAPSLAVDPSHPAARLVTQGAHPDLAVLRRKAAGEGGRKTDATEISVEDVRAALGLFEATSGFGGWRVIVVDAADDLNRNSANALLKMLEEPPPNAVFLLVTHAPGRLLPTIRSRCRVLRFEPLEDAEIVAILRDLGPPWDDLDDDALAMAAGRAGGSVARALEGIDPETVALVRQVETLLDRLPTLDRKAMLALAERLAGRDGEADFAVVLQTCLDWIADRVSTRATEGPRRLAPLAEVWNTISQSAREAETYNLDRRPLVIGMLTRLAEAVRQSEARRA